MKSGSAVFVLALALAGLWVGGRSAAHAALGLAREAYGVWDRGGGHLVADYPYTLGQAYAELWSNIEPSRTNFDWTALDNLLQFADEQNQKFNVQILPIGGAAGSTVPLWMSNNVPLFTESPNVAGYTYGYYLDPDYKTYFEEMVFALAKHLRTELDPKLQARIAFVRCDTGATGDEAPYENPNYITNIYQINAAQWLNFRLWAFDVYKRAFQDGTNGPVIPLLFQDIEQTGYLTEWQWVTNNVTGGFGGKLGGPVRGHNWSGSGSVSVSYRPYAVGGSLKIFSRNEMDQSWQDNPMFKSNLVLNMYWCAVEQLHVGMSVWDVSSSCLENASASNFVSSLLFFNKWSAHLDPPTAGAGFCILRDGLDATDTVRFPEADYGTASRSNTNRYVAICATNALDGARMDDPYAATRGALYQRNNQQGYNDSVWDDIPGNYERFITQIDPLNTSKGVWRINGATNGTLTSASHPFDRFGRRFDHASGKDAMYFDINDSLVVTPGQRVELTVIYRDTGTGSFALLYDAVTNSQKTAFTVTKGNTVKWKTNSVVVTDWAFANRGPNGADLVLTNLGTENTIFHSVELVKLASVNVGTVGKGTVSGRTDFTVYSPIMTNNVMERQRIGLTVTPAAGWKFTGWSGDTNNLSGGDVGVTNTRPFFFPTNGSQLTANFAVVTGTNSQPLFSSDPINKTPATNGVAYTGTLAGDASDPGGRTLTYSRVSGPSWLSVSNNGVLYGTPLSTDVGLNSWLVRITNGVGGSDDAILLIDVIGVPAPVGALATIAVADSTGGSISNASLTISQAFTVNTGNVLVANLSYRGGNNQYGYGPATLNWISGGGAVTQTMTRAVEAGNTAAKAYGSAVYYLWNPAPGSGTISGSLPPTNTAVHIISAFTLTGVDTNASPIIASNIDDNQTASSITSSPVSVPAGGFAALCAASAGTANGTGFANSPGGGTATNWVQNNYSGGCWDQGYILNLGGGNTTFSCAFVGNARMHIVAAVFTPGFISTNTNTYTLTYNAGANGSISGTSPQTVNSGASGSAVTALPNTGYIFTSWTDGVTANPRTDTGVTNNITVTANFIANTPPVITSALINGSNLIISGTNGSGAAGGTYYVRSSTNVVLPMASWQRISTNTYGVGGAFSVTNQVNLATPNNFYRLEQ